MARSSTRKRAAQHHPATPMLSSRDFARHLLGKAAEVAPSDVIALVARVDEIRAEVAGDQAEYATLAHRVRLALLLLSDHVQGACPQIPYHTVSLLTAALHYYIEPFDVIPDFIPHVGKADDAHVFELAWRLGRAGIERYVAWKGIAAPEKSRRTPARASARRTVRKRR